MKKPAVFIFQQRDWGVRLGHVLAKTLRSEGYRLGALTMKKSTHRFVLSQKDISYEIVIDHDELKEYPFRFKDAQKVSLAQICDDLEIDSVWPLISGIRNYVKSYRQKYYYSYRQNVPDELMVAYIKALYSKARKVFDEFSPDVIVTPNFVTASHLLFYYLARKRGIKMIALTNTRLPGLNMITHNHLDDNDRFDTYIKDLIDGNTESPCREEAIEYISCYRRNELVLDYMVEINKKPVKESMVKRIKREIVPYYLAFRWLLGDQNRANYIESMGATIDSRTPKIIIRDHYAQKRYKKFNETYSYVPLKNIGRCLFYPLQVQPEEYVDIMTPFASNQIETARQIAMSLPGDYTLVVKEHPAMAELRPPSYTEKIAQTPNVKLIDYRIPTPKVLEKCSAVVTNYGTVAAEAAFCHTPAIILCEGMMLKRFPNVVTHKNLENLSEVIIKILGMDLHTQEYEKKLLAVVCAMLHMGHKINYYALWEKGENSSIDNFINIYCEEIRREVKEKRS